MITGTKVRASRGAKFSAAAVVAALSLAGCSGGAKDKKAAPDAGKEGSTKLNYNPQDVSKLEKGGTLTLSVSSIGPDFNRSSKNGNTADLSSIMSAVNNAGMWNSKADGTFELDRNYAEDAKMEMKDGKQVITYTLNPKAKWNDGTPIDYKTFQNQAEVLSGKNKDYAVVTTAGYEDIEKVERGDKDNVVVITMKKATYPWQDLFGGLLHPAVNTPEIFNNGFKKPHPEWMAGPFKIDKHDEAARTITMVPNEKWWGDKPVLDKIVYRAMESESEIPAFKNGEIDAVGIANEARYKQAQGAANSEERRGQRLSVFGVVFNAKSDSPVKDLAVRKAIWQATDRKAMRDVRFKGLNWEESEPGSWMSMPFSPYYEDNMPVKQNLEEARKTLEAAGWTKDSEGIYEKGGKKLSLKLTNFGKDPVTAALAQTYQSQMKALGVDLKIDNRADSQFSETMGKRSFEMVMMGYSVGADPTDTPKQFYRAGSDNISGTGTDEVDKMIEDFVPTDDAAQRAKTVNAIEKKAMEQYGMLPMWNGPLIALYRKGLANFGPKLYLTTDWTKVGFEKGSSHK